MRNVALLERGWIGQGNVGRNTTIVRSNYLLDENAHFYEWSLKLWEGLSQTLDYNVMFSQRGVLNLAGSPGQPDGGAAARAAGRCGAPAAPPSWAGWRIAAMRCG